MAHAIVQAHFFYALMFYDSATAPIFRGIVSGGCVSSDLFLVAFFLNLSLIGWLIASV